MTKYQDLIEFIDRAKRSRKYPEATAHSLTTALRLYQAELNDEELASIDKFKANFEQITRSVFSKHQSRFTASSLATYRSRVQKVLTDFNKYSDPVKMNSWNPKVVTRLKKSSPSEKSKESRSTKDSSEDEVLGFQTNIPTHRIEFALREDARVLILLPRDITSTEIERVKTIIDAMTGTGVA